MCYDFFDGFIQGKKRPLLTAKIEASAGIADRDFPSTATADTGSNRVLRLFPVKGSGVSVIEDGYS